VFGFGRKRAALPAAERVTVTVAPTRTIGPVPGPIGYAAGYRGLPYLHASDQIGAFAGGQLTQRAGNVLEVQRKQGVEGLSAGWMVPGARQATLSWLADQQRAGYTGPQRSLGGTNGGLGPITAKAMRARVTAAQVRQSGTAAVDWARSLSPQA
jgi:hypothetical protein